MICNIWTCKCETLLFNGDTLCPWCKGRGGKFVNVSFKTRKFTVTKCILCQGEGKVDWIQAIMKKPPKGYSYLFSRQKDIKMRCTGADHCKKKLLRLFRQRDDNKYIGPNWKQVY